MISVDTTLPLANPYNLAQDIVDGLPELYEQLSIYDGNNDGFYDYLLGCIETRLHILAKLGVDEKDIPVDPNGVEYL